MAFFMINTDMQTLSTGSMMTPNRRIVDDGIDIYFDDVVLLMHMDGADDGTTFTDSSSNYEFLTSVGSVTSTDEMKFGTAALLNGSLGDGVTIAGRDIITDNQASFTIEAHIYILGDAYVGASIGEGGGSHAIVSQPYNGGSGECWLRVGSGSQNLGWYRTTSAFGGDLVNINGTTTINNDQWYHVALSYDASTTTARLFVDGNLDATNSSIPDGGWPNVVDNSMEDFKIADSLVPVFSGFQQTLNGYIDELRITQGVARYTESFTPPTVPTSAPDTSVDIVESGLLLHLDPANATCFGSAETSATNLISDEAVTGANGNPGTGAHTPNTANFPEWESNNGGRFDFVSGRGMNVEEDLGTHTEFTIDIWYYRDSSTGSLYLTDGRNDSGSWFLTNYTSNHNITFTDLATYNFDVAYNASNTDFINRWQHLTFTSDATSSKMYIDGTERTLISSSSVSENLGVNFRIGTRYTTTGEWSGYMGPIKIYDRVLTEAEALQNFNADKSRFDGF
jgi:hypothetical protein